MLTEGCGSSPEFVLPVEFRYPQKKAEFIKNYTGCLSGKKFFLDPGHGGNDRNNKGYDGRVVEADVNLRVAIALSELLKEAGANVILSRVKDTTVDLKDRSVIANKSGADFFISIHHNAPGEIEDICTDYTSTYYHAKETDYEYEPCQQNLARYIQRDLSYAMRNSGGPGSFDGTYSDYKIYPKQGFSVLRLTKIPAVLVECGYTTSRFEFKRIITDDFNKVEAWGIFRGICRYLEAGIPEIRFIKSESSGTDGKITIEFMLRDSSGIDPKTINVFMDSVSYGAYNFVKGNNLLVINVSSDRYREHIIKITAANNKGNYAFPFYYYVLFKNKMDK
jgi:N-acetylmuramoyl-L-alanine amidase